MRRRDRRALCEFSLCHSHAARWLKASRPDRARWIADGGGRPALPRTARCRFHECGLDSEGDAGLCQVHRARWARNGARPRRRGWLTARCSARTGSTCGRCPVLMRLEIAYAIPVPGRRTPHQDPPGPGPGFAAQARGQRGRLAEDWNTSLGFSSTPGDSERRFLLDAVGYLHDLADGADWDTEYPRYVWLPRRLGYPARDTVLRFDQIEHLWLREPTNAGPGGGCQPARHCPRCSPTSARSPCAPVRSPRPNAGPRR